MDQKVMNARSRTESGKKNSKLLRAEGRIPAIVYDNKGKAVMIDIDEKDFNKLHHLITESTLVNLKIDGKTDHEVFVKDVQHNIITDTFAHVDFYEVDPAQHLRTKVEIKLTGSPTGVRMGGVLETGITEIEVECFPRDLPPRIVVDVTDLDVNHSIHVKDLKISDKVKIWTDGGQTVAAIHFAKG